ncbi:hypothetical protein [Undibacterium sp. SXout20W]|uniref:hypothetical protein n=1 Tax=Undibacterium sp. SXout20W TaxID=3413051 RepID=UPI003BF27AC8
MQCNFVVATTLLLTLSACGGGGNANSSGSGNTSGSGSGTGSTSSSACAISSADPLIAVSLTGDIGNAQFQNGGTQLVYSGGLSGTLNLVNDPTIPASCMDSNGSATSMHTAMQGGTGSIGISHALVNGIDKPVFLMKASALAANTDLSSGAGNYVMLRYQNDTLGGGQTRMSYVNFVIDNAGNWSMCKNAPTCTTPTATGTIQAKAGTTNQFEFVSAGLVRGVSFVLGSGTSRILVNAEHDTGDGLVSGIHFGFPQSPWNPALNSYTSNSTDQSVSTGTLAAGSIIVKTQTHFLMANNPIEGIATTTTSDGQINYLISSPSGLLVTGNNVSNNFDNGPGYFSFGITQASN